MRGRRPLHRSPGVSRGRPGPESELGAPRLRHAEVGTSAEAGPGQAVVPPSPRGVGAREELPPGDEAPPQPVPGGAGTVEAPAPRRRSPRTGEAIGVVCQPHGPIEPRLQISIEGRPSRPSMFSTFWHETGAPARARLDSRRRRSRAPRSPRILTMSETAGELYRRRPGVGDAPLKQMSPRRQSRGSFLVPPMSSPTSSPEHIVARASGRRIRSYVALNGNVTVAPGGG